MLGNKFRRAKGSKYKNRFVRIDGHLFHSQKEAKWWLFLKEREDRGEITCLRKQVRYEIYRTKDGKPRHYIADFVFEEEAKERVVDVKSSFTAKDPVFKIKKELFECKHMKILEIWTTNPPKLMELPHTGPSDSPELLPKTPMPSSSSKSKKTTKSKKT